MATNSLIQYLPHTGTSLAGATVQLGTAISDRRQVETFLCETAITAGQVLALDVTKMVADPSGGFTAVTVVAADFNAATVQKLVVGVSLEAKTGTAGVPQPIRVVVRGPVAGVPVVAATAIGDALILDTAGAAGSAQVQTNVINEGGAAVIPIGTPFAYAMSLTGGAGTVTAYVLGLGI